MCDGESGILPLSPLQIFLFFFNLQKPQKATMAVTHFFWFMIVYYICSLFCTCMNFYAHLVLLAYYPTNMDNI